MTPDQPWMWHCGGMMWIFPMMMFIIMIVFFCLFIGRGRRRSTWWGFPWRGPGGHHREHGETDSAMEILKKRYVKGEITKEEFEQMKKDISS